MPVKTDREYRSFPLAKPPESPPEPDKKTISGYALTFNEPYCLGTAGGVEIWESVREDALEGADLSDVILQYNHEGPVMARIRNGTLRLSVDAHGLRFEADLSGTVHGLGLYEEISGRYVDRASIGMRVADDGNEWESVRENGKELLRRTITKIAKVYDVSAVAFPANEGTEVAARALSGGEIGRVLAERQEALNRKRRSLGLKIEMLRRKPQ